MKGADEMGKDIKGKELGKGITQRKDGRYQGRYRDARGKIKTFYDYDLKELEKKLHTYMAEDIVYGSAKQDMTMDEWFNLWMKFYKKSVRPNTKQAYTRIYNMRISPFIGKINMSKLNRITLQMVIDNAEEEGLGNEYQIKIRQILVDMLERAVEDDFLIKNVARGTKIATKKKKKLHAMTVSNQRAFLEACKGSMYENLFHVALNTGMRPGELFALMPDDIDLERNIINVDKTLTYQKFLNDDKKEFHLGKPKTESSIRKVPINSECRKYLMRQLERKKELQEKHPNGCDFLFTTRNNTPLNVSLEKNAIRNVAKKAGVPEPTPHDFRHTFATRCFENGVEAKTVQTYLGHSSIATTLDIYTHVTENVSQTDIEKIVSCEEYRTNKVVQFKKYVI